MLICIELLREGWYGSCRDHPEGSSYHKKAVNCQALWNKTLEIASKKFVAYCEGLNGAIGNLFIDETYQEEEVVLLIDTLVSTLIKEDSFEVVND